MIEDEGRYTADAEPGSQRLVLAYLLGVGVACEHRGGGLGVQAHTLGEPAQDVVLRDGQALPQVGREQSLFELTGLGATRMSDG